MYRNICIPTDGSPLSNLAVERGLALAKALGARATVLSVIQPFHAIAYSPELIADSREAYDRHAEQHAAQYLLEAEAKAKALGVACETVAAKDEHPYAAIISAAEAKGCDLIAMASHGRRGVTALVLGSETLKVLTHSTIPVLVFRQ